MAADNITKNAKLQADEYKAQIVRELDNVRKEVERERAKVEEFQDMYAKLVRKYLTKLDDGEMSGLHSRLDEIDRLIDHLMETDTALNRERFAPEFKPKQFPRTPLSGDDLEDEDDESADE